MLRLRQRSENEGDRSRDRDAEEHAEPRIPAEVQPLRLAGRHDVPDDEPGDAVDGHLGQRDHSAVRGEEDQARCGDTEEKHLRQDEADPVGAEDQRPECDENECANPDEALDRLLNVDGLHAGFPNSPCGRNARTIARRTNVKMIE